MHALLALLCVRVAALQRAEIIAAPSAKELERVAPQLICAGDCVLSAGVALESQAEMLRRLAGHVVSVDVPRKASQSRQELFRSDDDVRPLTRAGDVTAALRPDEKFDCVVVDAAAPETWAEALVLLEELVGAVHEKPIGVVLNKLDADGADGSAARGLLGLEDRAVDVFEGSLTGKGALVDDLKAFALAARPKN